MGTSKDVEYVTLPLMDGTKLSVDKKIKPSIIRELDKKSCEIVLAGLGTYIIKGTKASIEKTYSTPVINNVYIAVKCTSYEGNQLGDFYGAVRHTINISLLNRLFQNRLSVLEFYGHTSYEEPDHTVYPALCTPGKGLSNPRNGTVHSFKVSVLDKRMDADSIEQTFINGFAEYCCRYDYMDDVLYENMANNCIITGVTSAASPNTFKRKAVKLLHDSHVVLVNIVGNQKFY